MSSIILMYLYWNEDFSIIIDLSQAQLLRPNFYYVEYDSLFQHPTSSKITSINICDTPVRHRIFHFGAQTSSISRTTRSGSAPGRSILFKTCNRMFYVNNNITHKNIISPVYALSGLRSMKWNKHQRMRKKK
jgi:hypothetical protein